MISVVILKIYLSTKTVHDNSVSPVYTKPSFDFKGIITGNPLLQNENNKESQFDLRIIVITYNRPESLLRLLNSLNNAEYFNESVKIEVWVDISEDGSKDILTIEAANKFEFKHGPYEVHVRETHAGIYGQWLTSWKPSIFSSEIGVILEDDLTVSPFFYKYIKAVHNKYDSYPEINGYALQGYSIKHHIRDISTLEGPNGSFVFLYPVLGTWGFSPITTKWIAFLDWFYSLRTSTDVNPYVPDNIASEWFYTFLTQGEANKMWSMWHIYYAWLNDQYTLYSNFPGRYYSSFLLRKSIEVCPLVPVIMHGSAPEILLHK